MATPTGNPFYTAVEDNAPEYIPLPMEQLLMAGQAIQGRADIAHQTLDATQQGLSSMEAYAPKHIEYRDQLAGSFRQEASDLLDRYGGRASDPQFQREMKRMVNRYSSDPNLSVITQANQLYKDKLKSINKINESGGRYIDTNPRFTGADEQGNLVADVGSVRKTTWESDLEGAFKEAAKSMMGDGSVTSNEMALMNTRERFIRGMGADPITQEALQYFAGQGYGQEESMAMVQNVIDRLANSSLSVKKDDMNERLAISRANLDVNRGRLALAQRKQKLDELKEFDNVPGGGLFTSWGQSDIKNIDGSKKEVLKTIDDMQKNIDPNTGQFLDAIDTQFRYEDTKANREKLNKIGGFTTQRVSLDPDEAVGSRSFGPSAMMKTVLIPKGEAMQKATTEAYTDKINYIKEELGLADDVTPKEALNRYKEHINSNAYKPTSVKPTVTGAAKAFYETHGTDLSNAVLLKSNGDTERINPEKFDMSKFSNGKLSEIITYGVNGLGDSPATAVYTATHDGKQITYYTPAPTELIQSMPLTMMESMARQMQLTNEELRDPNTGLIQQTGNGKTVAPFIGPGGFQLVELHPYNEGDPNSLQPIRNSDGSFKFISDDVVRKEGMKERSNLEKSLIGSYRSTVRQEK